MAEEVEGGAAVRRGWGACRGTGGHWGPPVQTQEVREVEHLAGPGSDAEACPRRGLQGTRPSVSHQTGPAARLSGLW